MSLAEELAAEVDEIISTMWQARDGYVVPEAEDVALGNQAVKLKATVLYADLAESTSLVQIGQLRDGSLAATCDAPRIIRSEGGTITARR
jgi:hypothetical protein